MTSSVMMALGSYRFSLSTAAYQQLRRTTPFRWAEQPRFAREPGLQFTGPGKETIELEGVILTTFKGGLGQLDAMRAEAGKGVPLVLTDGLGKAWGKYVIEEVAETQTVFLPGGIPKKIEFSLRLSRYGEDA
ncbi:MAG: phage tail protein [Desulfovibrionaceae bacterium]